MQLSKKQKRFWQIFIAFVNSIKIQNILKKKKKKKKSLIACVFSKLLSSKYVVT